MFQELLAADDDDFVTKVRERDDGASNLKNPHRFDVDAYKAKNVIHASFYNDFDDVCAE